MISTFSDAFIRLTDCHAAWGAQQLELFGEFAPGGDWSAELDQCLFRQNGREMRVSMLGTFDVQDSSWLWGWANPGFRGTAVTGAAEAVRRFGMEQGVREFAEEGVDLSGFDNPRWAVERLVFGAMGVLGAAGYIGVQASAEARLYLVPDDPAVPRATPDPITLPRVLMNGVELVGGPAWPVVNGYFAHHGLPQRQGPGLIEAQFPTGSTAKVTFDEAGRIGSVSVNAVPAR